MHNEFWNIAQETINITFIINIVKNTKIVVYNLNNDADYRNVINIINSTCTGIF